MAGMVGEALVSSFFGVLFDRLASQEVLEFFRQSELTPVLNELKISLLSANVLLNVAEEKQLRDQNVKKWLVELKEVLYEADRVMDKINTEALRLKLENGESGSKKRKFWNLLPTSFSSFGNTVKSEIEEIHSTLKHLLSQTDFLGLKNVDHKPPPHRIEAPLVEEHDVFGRNDDKDAIIKLLLSDDIGGHRISVIPIVGMGGIGKTTLAQLVYNDSSVQEHFDLKAWVTVSEVFDVFKITKIIFEGITKRKCETEELHQLQKNLKEALMGKKFLFVHDDVWNEQYELWDLLKSSFESGARGSKIIVTTRSAVVARRMGSIQAFNLQLISNDDCWQLFAKHVFNNIGSDAPSDLLDIGKQIVNKCKGLPLAIKSMAGLLRCTLNPEEWRRVLQSDIWELQNQDSCNTNIIPALWLSYHFLPPILKRCFAYLSIFPKDHEFDQVERQLIIRMWMADGLLQPQNGKTLEDVGEEYLNALVSRSFFQQSYNVWDESAFSFHDLMHDLATFVSSEFCFVYGSGNELHNLTSKTHYLSFNNGFENSIAYVDFSKAKYLRNLIDLRTYAPSSQKVLHELFLGVGGCLRVLSLSKSSIRELPETIGKLKHLRYLDVSKTKIKEIPSSVCTLYNLQTLLLGFCFNFTQLPTNISKLINLRHLATCHTPLKEMPPQMCNLTSLQTLSNFVLSENDGSRIKELGELQLLLGSLCISGLENVKDVGDVFDANLKNKKHLNELILIWKGETDDSSKQREVLNALQPHVSLKKLEIIGYRGTILPNLVAHPSVFPSSSHVDAAYPSLQNLRLRNCSRLESFPEMGLPSTLKVLDISECNLLIANRMSWNLGRLSSLVELKLNGNEDAVESFPEEGLLPTTLRELTIERFKKLKALNGKGFQHLTSLQLLSLSFCRQLECLPAEGLPHTLSHLYIFGCTLLEPRCNRETGEDWPKIQHIPRVDIIGGDFDY